MKINRNRLVEAALAQLERAPVLDNLKVRFAAVRAFK
jgi:hypothetical protein